MPQPPAAELLLAVVEPPAAAELLLVVVEPPAAELPVVQLEIAAVPDPAATVRRKDDAGQGLLQLQDALKQLVVLLWQHLLISKL